MPENSITVTLKTHDDVNELTTWITMFKIECIPCSICLLDLLAGPADKYFIIQICLNGQTWNVKLEICSLNL